MRGPRERTPQDARNPLAGTGVAHRRPGRPDPPLRTCHRYFCRTPVLCLFLGDAVASEPWRSECREPAFVSAHNYRISRPRFFAPAAEAIRPSSKLKTTNLINLLIFFRQNSIINIQCTHMHIHTYLGTIITLSTCAQKPAYIRSNRVHCIDAYTLCVSVCTNVDIHECRNIDVYTQIRPGHLPGRRTCDPDPECDDDDGCGGGEGRQGQRLGAGQARGSACFTASIIIPWPRIGNVWQTRPPYHFPPTSTLANGWLPFLYLKRIISERHARVLRFLCS